MKRIIESINNNKCTRLHTFDLDGFKTEITTWNNKDEVICITFDNKKNSKQFVYNKSEVIEMLTNEAYKDYKINKKRGKNEFELYEV